MTEPSARLGPVAVLLDTTALLALGAGNKLLSRLVVAAHAQSKRFLYAPAMCLAAATAQRPTLAAHIGALPAIEVLDLGFVEASAVGAVIAEGASWQLAHALTTAGPSVEWPRGLPVLTTEAGPYEARGIRTIPVT
jgi:hypothetical protein